jgi:hypothetical protein
MSAGIRNGLLAIYAVLILALPAYSETRTFAQLLAEAKIQAATGHRWAPPGDNMTETVMRMMDIIGTATPAQLSELSGLLASDKTLPPSPEPSVSSLPEERPIPAVPTLSPTPPLPNPQLPSPSSLSSSSASPPIANPPLVSQPLVSQPLVSPPPPALALAPPKAPPVLPDLPERGQGSPIASSQATPDPGSRAGALYARGLDAELRGDFSGARRFYAGAAGRGDAAAARNLGRLYDPAYLKQHALGGVDPDPALARYWYERAVRFGDPEAGLLLQALSVR